MAFSVIRKLASSLVPNGLPIPVVRGPLRGRKWIAGAAAGGGKGLSIVINETEPDQLALALKLFPENGVAFDIGANVGLYSLLLSSKASKVIAFEPLPRNIRYLARTLEVNNITNVLIVPCAVAESMSLLAFADGENCALGHLSEAGEQPVVSVSCDEFSARFELIPDLIKIDVEGAEELVLRGARNILSNHKPTVLLSIHSDELRDSCIRFLQRLGYSEVTPINSSHFSSATEFVVKS